MLKRRAFKRDFSLQKFMLNGNNSNKIDYSYPKENTE